MLGTMTKRSIQGSWSYMVYDREHRVRCKMPNIGRLDHSYRSQEIAAVKEALGFPFLLLVVQL